VYDTARNNRPYSDHPSLIDLQKLNGVNVGRVLHSNVICADIIDHIAKEMRTKLVKTITTTKPHPPIAILIDESTSLSQKSCLIVYVRCHAVHIGQPNYLNKLIQPYQPVRTLRSSTSALLVIPFVRSDFASDAFSVSAPTLWNNLPQDVRSCVNQATFKSRLKLHLFSLAFTV